MKVDGITLLQMIKDGEIEKNTKIKVWMKTQSLKNLVTTLNYDGINLNWDSGTFYANFFWDKNYGFEIIEEDKPIEPIDSDYFHTNDTRYNELIDEIALNRELIIELKKESDK